MKEQNNPLFPGRPPRLTNVFSSAPLYFITFNTWKRRPLLANEIVHTAFCHYADKNKDRGFAVGRYVIMPDHIHLFVRVGAERKLSQYIRLMKQVLTKQIGTRAEVQHVWQPGFFDHLMRSSESYSEKWNYVRLNPVRAGLVTESKHWHFQGELVPIHF